MKTGFLVSVCFFVCAQVFAADWHAPAEYTVSTTVLNEDPGGWTATMSDGPINAWIHDGAFEPMVLRRKWHVLEDSPNELIIQRSDMDGYNSYRDGIFDDATVRIYRIVNGQFEKIREDTIAHHYSSGWYLPEGELGKLTSA